MDEVGPERKKKRRTERISTWFRSKLSSVSVERRKTICALTMVWMLVLGVGLGLLSIAEDLDGVSDRREMVAVFEEFMGGRTGLVECVVVVVRGGGGGAAWPQRRAAAQYWACIIILSRICNSA